MSFTIADAQTLAHTWFDDIIEDADALVWGNEFIRRRVSDRLWAETTKEYAEAIAPSTDPTIAASGSGSITGTYKVKVTFVDADGAESDCNTTEVSVTASSNLQFDWSAIPTRTGCTRKLYRTKAGGDKYYYVAAIADATTTTYTDTTADSSLTVPMNIKTKYTLPTAFYRAVMVEDSNAEDYAGYKINNGKIEFALNGDYTLTYIPYPTALAAITGAGNDVPLPDVFMYPMAEYLIFKYYNIEIDDEDSKLYANEYEARYQDSLKDIYNTMEINSETESFQVGLRW